MVLQSLDQSLRYFSDREHAFSFLLAKPRESQPSSAKLAITAHNTNRHCRVRVYAVANLFRNNCTTNSQRDLDSLILDSPVGRALRWYRRSHGLESSSGLLFFRH